MAGEPKIMMNNQINNCPVCHSTNWEQDEGAGKLLGLSSTYQVLACSNCKLRRLHPQLNQDELNDLYSQGYFNSASLEKSKQEFEFPENYMDVVIGRHEKFYQVVMELKDLFPSAKNFLDVGAATGDMVHIARKAGFNADGIELSKFAVDQAKKNFGIVLKNIEISEVLDSQYDIVHLNHVFEHFNDPVAELNHLFRIINNGGGLYLEIPYQFHFIERIKNFILPKNTVFSLHSVHHPFFYTPYTIKKILHDHGFSILRFRVFSRDRYPSKTLFQKIKLHLWRVLSWFGVGNYIELTAVKKIKRS
jgi:SAM-dependent methyltransferase